MKIVKVQKGTNTMTISIPAEIRKELDIKAGDELVIRHKKNSIIIKKLKDLNVDMED